jgi:rhodanese-related sulfurtransferase
LGKKKIRNVLLEGLLVAVAGAAVAFAANALSPRGLSLSRNYYGGAVGPPNLSPSTNTLTAARRLAARLAGKGLLLADSNQVAQLFHDPRCQQGLVVFVDARSDEDYQAGHVPGAYEFPYYHYEKFFGPVVMACQAAEQVVVYCGGGECEDSELAATMLRDAGITNQGKLFVYGGGWTEWSTNRMPAEAGQRGSGQLLKNR